MKNLTRFEHVCGCGCGNGSEGIVAASSAKPDLYLAAQSVYLADPDNNHFHF